MPQIPEAKVLARAVRRHGMGLVDQYAQKIVKATVVGTDPLIVELLRNDVQIESEHLLLGSWVRYYDARYGLVEDDTVLMLCLDDNDWFVIDVISQEDFDLGDHPEDLTATAYNTGSGHVTAEIPYQDEDGNVLGVLLLFDPATLRDFHGHDTTNSNPVRAD